MKVLLLKDVYKLGRAGDVKKVADGYGRNYLIPQGLAALATPGALKQAEHIKSKATIQRAILNKEMDVVAQKLVGVVLTFSAKASETGKLVRLDHQPDDRRFDPEKGRPRDPAPPDRFPADPHPRRIQCAHPPDRGFDPDSQGDRAP